jgi:hypothetical protein
VFADVALFVRLVFDKKLRATCWAYSLAQWNAQMPDASDVYCNLKMRRWTYCGVCMLACTLAADAGPLPRWLVQHGLLG